MDNYRLILFPLIILMAITLSGCGETGDGSNVTAYSLSSADAELITPEDRENVVVDTDITVRFDQEMNMNTVNSSTFILKKKSGSNVGGVFTYTSDNKTVYFDPTSDLDASSDYTISIADTVKDHLGNLFKGKKWTFTTEASDSTDDTEDSTNDTDPSFEIANSFGFGPTEDGFSRVKVLTSIINDSTCDITVQILAEEDEIFDSRNYSVDVSDDTELNFYYLNETNVISYTDKTEGEEILAVQRYFLNLEITLNNGIRSWNVLGSGSDMQKIEPIRLLYVEGDPDTIIIRETYDEEIEILDIGVGVDASVDAYMRTQIIESNWQTTVGKAKWSWWNCDDEKCESDMVMSLLVDYDDSDPNNYVDFYPDITPIDTNDSIMLIATNARNMNYGDNSGEIELYTDENDIKHTKYMYMNIETPSSPNWRWVTKLEQCQDWGRDAGSIAAFSGHTYAVFVQMLSSIESSSDSVTAKIVWYENIDDVWEYQGENNSLVLNESDPTTDSPEGITDLQLKVYDYAPYCSGDGTMLKISVPEEWW